MCVVEFEGGVIGLAEDSWAKPGGMDDRIEVYGTKGVSFADLFRGNSRPTYSEEGYGYAAEKAGSTQGWTFTIFEEVFNQGYPHELQHFIECVREDKTPLVTGEDGRAVLEMIYAAYASARSGAKVVAAVPAEGQQADRSVEGIGASSQVLQGAPGVRCSTCARGPCVVTARRWRRGPARRSPTASARAAGSNTGSTQQSPARETCGTARCDSLSSTTPVMPPAPGN